MTLFGKSKPPLSKGASALPKKWSLRSFLCKAKSLLRSTLQDSAGFVPADYWEILKGRLLDLQSLRIKEMDENGIEFMLLSLNAPAIQAIPDRAHAIEISRR